MSSFALFLVFIFFYTVQFVEGSQKIINILEDYKGWSIDALHKTENSCTFYFNCGRDCFSDYRSDLKLFIEFIPDSKLSYSKRNWPEGTGTGGDENTFEMYLNNKYGKNTNIFKSPDSISFDLNVTFSEVNLNLNKVIQAFLFNDQFIYGNPSINRIEQNAYDKDPNQSYQITILLCITIAIIILLGIWAIFATLKLIEWKRETNKLTLDIWNEVHGFKDSNQPNNLNLDQPHYVNAII
ncbi:UNVERIFIED_CONTAM: hypothetical protein RMT77_011260 [Armadillidium vulgare]